MLPLVVHLCARCESCNDAASGRALVHARSLFPLRGAVAAACDWATSSAGMHATTIAGRACLGRAFSRHCATSVE